MAQGGRNHLSAVTSRRQNTSSARADKGILGIVVCIGVALLQSPSVRAQDAVQKVLPEETILPELSKRTGPEPMKVHGTPIPDTEKPSLEVLAGTPSEKPVPMCQSPTNDIVLESRPPVDDRRRLPAPAIFQSYTHTRTCARGSVSKLDPET